MASPKKDKEKKKVDLITDGQRITRLEKIIAKMAHYNGNEAILREFDIEPWVPGKSDMSKWDK